MMLLINCLGRAAAKGILITSAFAPSCARWRHLMAGRFCCFGPNAGAPLPNSKAGALGVAESIKRLWLMWLQTEEEEEEIIADDA